MGHFGWTRDTVGCRDGQKWEILAGLRIGCSGGHQNGKILAGLRIACSGGHQNGKIWLD